MAEDGSNEDSDSAWVDEDTDAEDVDGEKLTIDDDPICDSKDNRLCFDIRLMFGY